MKTIISLVGARPQFVKEAGIGNSFRNRKDLSYLLVHSGQHYDFNMSDIFFQELGIHQPEYNLGVGSSSHGKQTAEVLSSLEELLLREEPDLLLVYGDTNTTLAGALAASKLKIPVAHVEAGIRQEPRNMPEEINRVLTDHVSSLLCCCSDLSRENLEKEGIYRGVHVVGDIMLDVYRKMEKGFDREKGVQNMGLSEGKYMVMTLHRDFNVDDPASLKAILEGISRLSQETRLEVLFPIHPRTKKRVSEFGLEDKLKGLRVVEPMGYLELMSLVQGCRYVITDSGGLQKEAYFAGKRALVIMPDTGWRELTNYGWNILAAPDPESIVQSGLSLMDPLPYPDTVYGSGNTSDQIVEILEGYLEGR